MRRSIGLILGVALLVGCSPSQPAPSAASPQPAANPPAPPPAPPAVPTKPTIVEKKAEVGVGEKGHYDTTGPASIITVPVASLFTVRERLAFDVKIPEAMKLFKATEGRAPKSHEEFMERIVKENNITLPELPPENRYLYDPKTEQLMVQQPSK